MRRSFAKIAEAAEALLVHHGIAGAPVDVEGLARSCGAVIERQPFEGDLSGLLYREGDDVLVIGVNSTHAMVRQRFTIAHELGHWALHKGRELTVDRSVRVNFRDATSSFATDVEEVEANAFAAALLTPEAWLRTELANQLRRDPGKSDDELVEKLAKVFAVSQQSMDYRLTNLGLKLLS